jgi:RNA polymerase sigma-70 factor, ECF subfamily
VCHIETPLAWLVTTTTRACIDRLRALATQRQSYEGSWLPEPLLGEGPSELGDDLSVAFLLLLERLSPDERANVSAAYGIRIRSRRHCDQAAVLELLATDVTYTSDSGGRVRAARRVLHGADRVGRFLIGIRRKFRTGDSSRIDLVAGASGIVRERNGKIIALTAIETDERRIVAFYSVLNPDKLPRARARSE